MTELLAAIGLFVVFLGTVGVLGVVYAAWQGYVLSILWRWFMVTLFHLPVLSIGSCVGLTLIVSVLAHQYIPPAKDQSTSEKVMSILSPFISGSVALFVGWLVRP